MFLVYARVSLSKRSSGIARINFPVDRTSVSKIVGHSDFLRKLNEADGPLRQSELCDRLDKSKSTTHRKMKYLEKEGIVEKSDGTYELTDYGEFIAMRTERYLSEMVDIEKYRDFLSTVADTELGLDFISGASVTHSTDGNPMAPLVRLTELTSRSEEILVLTNSIAPESFEIGRQGIREGTKTVKMIIDRRTLDSIRGSDLYGEELRKDLSTGNLSLWIHDEPIEYQIGVMDGVLCLGAEDENRMPVAMLETEDKEAVSWGKRVFKEFKSRSEMLYISDV